MAEADPKSSRSSRGGKADADSFATGSSGFGKKCGKRKDEDEEGTVAEAGGRKRGKKGGNKKQRT